MFKWLYLKSIGFNKFDFELVPFEVQNEYSPYVFDVRVNYKKRQVWFRRGLTFFGEQNQSNLWLQCFSMGGSTNYHKYHKIIFCDSEDIIYENVDVDYISKMIQGKIQHKKMWGDHLVDTHFVTKLNLESKLMVFLKMFWL